VDPLDAAVQDQIRKLIHRSGIKHRYPQPATVACGCNPSHGRQGFEGVCSVPEG
jgi:hypothetical protein